MKDTLKPGIKHSFSYVVPENKTVPHLIPEAGELQKMPAVLASGYMIGLIEWTCIQATNPHLDWPTEQTLGVGFDLTHAAPTPPGMTVTIEATLEKVEGKKLTWAIVARDDVDVISKGYHYRYVVMAEKFLAGVKKKTDQVKG